jgi:metalloendopeptidase OMA1, mitochondrial
MCLYLRVNRSEGEIKKTTSVGRCFIAILLTGWLASCETAPVTGRSQLILIPESEMNQLGVEAYKQIISKSKLSRDPTYTHPVEEIGRRIAAVSGHPEYKWEFNVIEDPTPNAFALPGGKVGVHTGLFKVAKNKAQLAAVMGHEIAHAIVRHGAERMSQQLVVQGGLQGLDFVLGMSGTKSTSSYVQLAAAAATLGVILPFSRDQEAEADHIGLLYAAKARYDPRQAIELWKNFEAYGGDRAPEFLSTHPAPGSRIDRLEAMMPEAMAVYQQSYPTRRTSPSLGEDVR